MHRRIAHVEFDALLGAGLVAGVHAGLLLQIWSLDWLHYFAWSVGRSSLSAAWFVLLVGSLVPAALLVAVFERFDYRAVSLVLGLRERNAVAARVLGPLLRVSVLGTTLAGIGLAGGLVVGVVGYGLLLPLWLTAGGWPVPVPLLHPVSVAAWGVFGAVLGLLYGSWTTADWGPGWG